ncbi:hypothetical protein PC116_g15616 [Phytophthora cactorum]|uniref:Uncharacterized protein n=1 Tax=Phytophthora cactorum TaxID=29920 RepID=A0A8T1EEN9_9STRA|nr:hypothetical protein PC117_g3512 [Phytophthora cactorum]KAG4236295.1 hypothetical protein PC116_g15616 [Phytophthora cactorum]
MTQAVSCHQHLVTQLQATLHPGVTVVDVHPHPRVSRLMCLWVGARRWAISRRRYKHALMRAWQRQDKGQVERRVHKWKALSCHAAAGLKDPSWPRIRQIVGLTPWGEQLLYRLKLQVSSLCILEGHQWGVHTLHASARRRCIFIMSFGHARQWCRCAKFFSNGGSNWDCPKEAWNVISSLSIQHRPQRSVGAHGPSSALNDPVRFGPTCERYHYHVRALLGNRHGALLSQRVVMAGRLLR